MKNNGLSSKVKELRKRKGFLQEELAEKSGLSVQTIQRIENGESDPTEESIKRISVALEVTPDELIDWKVQKDNSFLVIMSLSALSFFTLSLAWNYYSINFLDPKKG
jgi:transcriptional regulator with XRE-family HTH domain